MKICVTCIYWSLLFISVASSALLFIIVASENTQSKHYSSFKKNETSKTYDNDTLIDMGPDNLDTSTILINELQDLRNVERNYKDHYYHEEFTEEPTGFQTVTNDETRKAENPYKDPDIVAESLTQQPNLSQGMSENEQATLLTLMDTTVAELQSLAEPKLTSDFPRTRLYPKNSSLLTKAGGNIAQKTKQEQLEISATSTIVDDETTEKSNVTDNFEEGSLLPNLGDQETPEVLVVRAEQVPITESDSKGSGIKSGETTTSETITTEKVDGPFITNPELIDIEAEARLLEDSRDEVTATILGDEIVPVASTSPHEDIPSFSEWTQKRLEEAEKKKTHPNASVQNSGAATRGTGGMKVRSKNYASPDCGAKIVAANAEARSARSVLVSTRDEYMLNTCTSRIWFVVELCEAIQAKKIELANFELFSSSPKDFSVYISDRFPTRDWSPVGQFTAKDMKDIQSFALQPQLFGKFIKVELQTYYGSEHFCPISLFCAYGTSEFEVLETETENQAPREVHAHVDDEEDSDEEEVLDTQDGEPPRNLFGSARDAVLSIMKKAAEVLVKSSDLTYNNITKIQQSIDSGNILQNSFVSCTTPRYTILCDNCSDQEFAKIFQLVSCREQQLNQLLKIDLVNRTLKQTGLCKMHGVRVEDFATKGIENVNTGQEKFDQTLGTTKNFQLTFITSILRSEYVAALCNVLAIKERKMVMNTSHEILLNFKETTKEDKQKELSSDAIKSVHHVTTTRSTNTNLDTFSRDSKKSTLDSLNRDVNKFTNTPIETSSSSESILSQKKPTKLSEKEEVKNDSLISTVESSKDSTEETVKPETTVKSRITVPVSLNIGQNPTPTPGDQHSGTQEPFFTTGTSGESSVQPMTSQSITDIDINEIPTNEIAFDMEFSDTNIPNRVEKVDRLDHEGKQGQTESSENAQEMKLPSQDALVFDNILSDLKDFEAEAVHIHNGPATSASVAQSTTNTTPQKESVFLRLSNRIKALERNMSLSGQYLEELSWRYKKQVEEMQKSLERTVSAMSEETRKRDERELKRAEEIAILRDEIMNLSNSVKNLIYDRDSWRGKISMLAQQILLICSKALVIYLILLYCWGKPVETKEKTRSEKDVTRRKSAENFGSHIKKVKKRRPSEIASHITGTYRELMISHRSHESKKEKKRKRRRTTTLIGDQANTQQEIVPNIVDKIGVIRTVPSSVEVLQTTDFHNPVACKKLKSASESNVDRFVESEMKYNILLSNVDSSKMGSARDLELNVSYIENSNETNSSSSNTFPEKSKEHTSNELSTDLFNSKSISGILKDTRLNVTSSFMRTALSTRRKRKTYLNDVNGEWNDGIDDKNQDNLVYSEKIDTDADTTVNGTLMNQSDESRSSSVTSMLKKKEKKGTGFRKMSRYSFRSV
ncbi:SUN domain-containing ossification factor isoform X2 [Ceratina calcarata]|uniref:SUN domain-containing ossification factor isoform X2 n=1 Tax=Ceratina calcarata TaxID=156304 RepID=A0AAJ7J1K0_9HYME|nr:SUN domain-containing ossification factor isoform X2 [Ceratina calcarata]